MEQRPQRNAGQGPSLTLAAGDTSKARRRVLGVGVATLDIINRVAVYPLEDTEVRAHGQRRARGGNCTNTLTVLADLGHACAWAGTLADDAAGVFIETDLTAQGVDCTHALRIPGSRSPTSYVALSDATGSRTIVHYRDLPELTAADFTQVPPDGWDWIHFEGRNPGETRRMIERCRRASPHRPISVEIEKPRPAIDTLFHVPDLLLISRAFALADGVPGTGDDPGAWLKSFAERTDARLLVLAWGALGAWLLVRGAAAVQVPARPPERVVDSLGAGDVLNAGMIDGLLRGLAPVDALTGAVALASLKCGRHGLAGLAAARMQT
jgi:ketohexokinase